MNFDNFHQNLLLLIKICTKEEWDAIMYEMFENNDNSIVTLYLVSFVIVSSFIMMNLFIMVIVD